MKDELIDIYNERIELIGTMPRKEAHRQGHWHKAIHCWILGRDQNNEGYILFQLRSKEKDMVPNSLDISAAGHLKSGENPQDGIRELEEELGVKAQGDKLRFLGVHVEVYCDDRNINREFDYVYFLEDNRDLLQYTVQPNEVIGLTKVKINDGIKLFGKTVDSIVAESVIFNETGEVSEEFNQQLKISAFAGGERNNYFIKIFLLAEQYFSGKKLLYI